MRNADHLEPPRLSRRAPLREHRHATWGGLPGIVRLLELRWRPIAERFEQAAVVVPGDPFEGRELDVLEPLPGPTTIDLFRLEQPDHAFGQGVGDDSKFEQITADRKHERDCRGYNRL